jgi:tetratricopeptide (TPR) repeat protein
VSADRLGKTRLVPNTNTMSFRRVLVLIAAFVLTGPPSADAQPTGRILVVPFEHAQHEPKFQWLGEAAAILLADELNARGVGAITRPERVRAFEQLHLPPNASLSRATMIKVGQLVGASEVVVGSFKIEGADLHVTANAIRVDVGRLQPAVVERAPLTELFALFERLAGRLASDARAPAGTRAARPPLDVFENFVKGLLADSPAMQATFLETAIRDYPAFDRAQIALWGVRSDQGDHAAALAAARAVPATSPFAARARFLAGVSQLELNDHQAAFTTFRALLDDAATAVNTPRAKAAILNNVGLAQMRRGTDAENGSALYYLTKATDADGGNPDYLFNLGYAYVLDRNYQGGTYWLREALRRNPADADAHFVLAVALHAAGSHVEAAREFELARQLSSRYEQLERKEGAEKLTAASELERIAYDLDGGSLRTDLMVVNTAQREQEDLAGFHLERGQRLFDREQDREALVELRRAVYLSPYQAQAHLLIGRIHLRAGRPREAIDALKISIWSEDTAPARVVIAEAYLKSGDAASAKSNAEKALALDPASEQAKRLLASMR